MKNNKNAFTLVEVMVAITIFLVVMVSVMQIFLISNQLTNKIDINRQVQENIKNLTEAISEDIRNYWIWWASNSIDDYSLNIWNGLCLWKDIANCDIKYYISNEENLIRKVDITECSDLNKNCFLVKHDWTPSRMTNSWVAFEDLNFTILWNQKKKLVINFTMRPSTKKWINSDMIKNSKVIFQTTISERFVKTN